MTIFIVSFVVVLAAIAAVGVWSYNRFVSQRQLLLDAWSNLDTELRRRHDLVPNLVSTVKGYAGHERGTLDEVAEARSQARQVSSDPASAAAEAQGAEQAVSSTLHSLLAVAEAYPDLKADARFADLQSELVATEDRIQAARRLYNNNVRRYNQRVESLPSLVVARIAHFERASYFELASSTEAEAPSVAEPLGPRGAGGA